MRLQRSIRRIHKILGAVVALQLLMWMVSGVYMTAVPIETVRGNHLLEEAEPPMLDEVNWKAVQAIFSEYKQVEFVSLSHRLDQPVYVIHSTSGEHVLHGETGKPLDDISEQQARDLALQVYVGEADIGSIRLITDIDMAPEARGRDVPLWQVSFDDTFSSTFYISAKWGNIVAVRSDIWRWFDFLWMLHIMDYDERDDFNNPLVILMATLGLFLTISGFVMLGNALNRKGIKGLL